MKFFIRNIYVAMLYIFLGGCLSTENITQKNSTLKAQEGVVVIGLPQGANALFWMGNYKDKIFQADGFFPKGVSLSNGEPYLVQKTDATKINRGYGLVSVNLGELMFGVGCNQSLPVLLLNVGEVQYFGDFTIEKKDNNVIVRQVFNIEKAQEYIDTKYPDNKWKLVLGKYEIAKTSECVTPVGVPIIIYI